MKPRRCPEFRAARLQLFTGQRLPMTGESVGLDRHGGDGFAFGVFDVVANAGQRAPVPTPEMARRLPLSVSSQISAAGGFSHGWPGLAGLLNCCRIRVTAWIGGDDLFRLARWRLSCLRPFGQHQIGAQRLEQLAALDAHVVSGMVSVSLQQARRRFTPAMPVLPLVGSQFFAGGQHAALFRIPNHIGTDAAFDALVSGCGFNLGRMRPPIRFRRTTAAYGRSLTEVVPIYPAPICLVFDPEM